MQEWWRGAVFYQIYPLSFRDSDGDGWGDLAGVEAGLDHVASLGVDGIWLSPFYRSPMADFGYDIADHCAVDERMGSLCQAERVIAAAHQRGLKVLLDMVWCHTAAAHPWFLASRAGRTSDKADWYVWADPKPDGAPPNNWLSVFGGSAWSWNAARRQYYLHPFLASQPKLNLRNPEVLAAQLAVARFWLDRGCDGFRLDAIDFLAHDPGLADNPPAADQGAAPANPFRAQQHVHDMRHPDGLRILDAIRGVLDDYPGRVALGEVSSEAGAHGQCGAYTSAAEHRLHLAYSMRGLKDPFDAGRLLDVAAEADRDIGDGWLAWALTTHDVARAAGRWGGADPDPRLAKLLLVLLFTLRGSVLLYQGEELGLADGVLAADQRRDPFGAAFAPVFPGRDGARTPMPWTDAAPHAGFTAGTPWLPVDPRHRRMSVAVQDRDPRSVLNFARSFLAWRRTRPSLRIGSFRRLELAAPLIGLVREAGDESIAIVVNPTPSAVAFEPPAPTLLGGGAETSLPPYGWWLGDMAAGQRAAAAA